MTIYIYNPNTRQMEHYTRALDEPMPYNLNRTLTVEEFRGASQTDLLWSDLRTMQAWNGFRAYWGRPIPVGFAFRRIWEGGHSAQSQHYAGMAFDCGQRLLRDEQIALHAAAVGFGGWTFVDAIANTPNWVHMDTRLAPPACPTGGYITNVRGDRGVYVMTMQDALWVLGFGGGGIDGIFGPRTKQALRDFQAANGLVADGICGCNTWRVLTDLSVGIRRE